MPKIKYGLSKVYYAKATIADDGSATYATPVALPGGVSLNMDAEGDNVIFYADNIRYWQGAANNGYSGSLELALVPRQFKIDCLGFIEGSDGVLYEDANATGSPFALLFQFQHDVSDTRYVFYNVIASRAAVAGSTKEESIDPETETLDLEAGTIYVEALDTNIVKGNTDENTSQADKDAWYDAVHLPTAPEDPNQNEQDPNNEGA